ncbi:hypothetical protein O6H91_06G034400 [Diphasiastrum complanatum]|nr:hypothetical protein O6H91_06G034400 [Diphasiastrum complanatum]
MDLGSIADKLDLGEKIWLLGFSGGGSCCWAAARYIPHRIAGIAMWAPMGNYFWKGISEQERKAMLATLSVPRTFMSLPRIIPLPILRLYVRFVIVPRAGHKWVKRCQTKLSPPDREHLQQSAASDLMLRDNLESLTFNKGSGMANDLKLCSSYWGFEVEEVAAVFKGPIHIWQGDDDSLIPLSMQQWIQRRIPNIVNLHVLPGEGHLSWFCFNPKGHRRVLVTLFNDSDSSGD